MVAVRSACRQNAPMHRTVKKPGWKCLGGLYLALLCLPVQAAGNSPRVLVLNSYDESAAPYFRPTEEFREKLQQFYPEPIIFQDIDLGQRRIEDQNTVDLSIAQLLLNRYRESPPDLVAAIGPPAIDFWTQRRDSIFPDALFVAMARESVLREAGLRPTDAPVATRFSFTGVAENIIQLKPDTSLIFMIFGDTVYERTLSAAAQMELAPWANQFSLEFTNDMAMHEVQDRLASLPPEAAVFFGIFSKDINGVMFKHYSSLKMARAASSVPVFGPFDDHLGQGIIGGSLIQAEQIGQDIAESAHELLSGTFKPNSMRLVELSAPTYDWRELNRWGLDSGRLPEGSHILFKPPSIWVQNATWLSWVGLVIAIQSFLLIALLRQRRRRRKAETAHASLGRRLITAHEDERRLLARELHDDLSQRLARAAIDASYARAQQGTPIADEALKTLQPELVRISRDVHDMSYRLHPSLVDDLGVVAALQSEIERVQRRTDVSVEGTFSEIERELSPETELCIFRIAQEALQNAIRHAHPTRVEISLWEDSQALKLTIRDNGMGFDVGKERDRFSLGLSSMKERAMLVNGRFTLRSKAGQGTVVALTVPLQGQSK